MKRRMLVLMSTITLLAALSSPIRLAAQEESSAATPAAIEPQSDNATTVPHLIKFSGVVKDSTGTVLTDVVGLTFTIYQAQEGGSPLWSETQSARLDERGRYTVLLGASSATGLPLDLFTSGKALWLGVQPQLPGAGEQPRALLVAVPYALKAADADTLGGKPASAFVTTESATGFSAAGSGVLSEAVNGGAALAQARSQIAPLSVGGSGATNYIPIWTGSATLGNSTFFESGGMVGLGTTSPSATLTVLGPNIRSTNGNAPAVLQITGGGGGPSLGHGGFGGAGAAVVITSGPGGNANPFGGGCCGGLGGAIQIPGGEGGFLGGSGAPIQITGGKGDVFKGAGGPVQSPAAAAAVPEVRYRSPAATALPTMLRVVQSPCNPASVVQVPHLSAASSSRPAAAKSASGRRTRPTRWKSRSAAPRSLTTGPPAVRAVGRPTSRRLMGRWKQSSGCAASPTIPSLTESTKSG